MNAYLLTCVVFLLLIVILLLKYYIEYHVLPRMYIASSYIAIPGGYPPIDYVVTGFYTTNYEANFIEFLKSKERVIPNVEIDYEKIDQVYMDECLSHCPKAGGMLNKFTGCNVKQLYLSHIIEKYKGRYILYCEADVIFLRPFDQLLSYYASQDCDIICGTCVASRMGTYNIGTPATGVMFIKCSSELAHTIRNTAFVIKDRCGWDEPCMLDALTNHKVCLFSSAFVSCYESLNPQTMIVKTAGLKDKLEIQRQLNLKFESKKYICTIENGQEPRHCGKSCQGQDNRQIFKWEQAPSGSWSLYSDGVDGARP